MGPRLYGTPTYLFKHETRVPSDNRGMPTNVIMPQMGESIFEGTVTKWLKKTGDTILRDEPLFEISTDKVDAEIPSPAGGVLTSVLVKEARPSRSTRLSRCSMATAPQLARPLRPPPLP